MIHDMQYNDILDILYTKSNKQTMTWLTTITKLKLSPQCPQWSRHCERPRPRPVFYGMMLGQTHVNGWSRVIASQNGGSTSYIFPLILGVLQWSRHLFNYWKNKKTIIEKFLILLI